ncbi:sulfite exporter TauE/SafE family protein [Sphingobacterium sp. FBM7-1]|uniref:sulfite exporter TauE/SafE family protein n=1 Tax=Sphingobacterium sp. FBM7-1 TaxID=2886688 RepID=UPI001D1051FF|nr:sulfite exporter TauE/SafE family protein [Sphingobacterium sp. FBM7-1]MCC2598778.1 sulfite exporter TauE/SafE family protein [Sphingobacterium sp. FBM7-1]
MELYIIALVLFIVGFLYASVGHGGASGYIAVFSLFSVPVAHYKSLILMLNMLVAGTGFLQFRRAGHFRWATCWPFLITSIPCAFLGARYALDGKVYFILLGLALILPTIRLLGIRPTEQPESKPVNTPLALFFGALIGLLSGMLHIGGGIFLSPLLILFGWANVKEAAATSTIFITLNSFSGLLGNSGSLHLDSSFALWFCAAAAGGFIGAYFGSARFAMPTVRSLLSLVLLIACCKLLFFM